MDIDDLDVGADSSDDDIFLDARSNTSSPGPDEQWSTLPCTSYESTNVRIPQDYSQLSAITQAPRHGHVPLAPAVVPGPSSVVLGKRPERSRSLDEATSAERPLITRGPPQHIYTGSRVSGLVVESTIQAINPAHPTQVLPGWHGFSADKVVVNSNINNYYYKARSAAGASRNNKQATVTAQEIANWLKAPSYADVLRKALNEQMEGTGEWFLESTEFKQLVDGSISALWGMGLAGSGKTVLSALSIRRLEEIVPRNMGVVIAYAFIRYREKHSARDILASLLAQITRADKDARRSLSPAYLRCKAEGQTIVTAKEIVGMLRSAVQHLEGLFLVIDGLDEASDTVKDALLDVLPQLQSTRLLIMSRPLTHLLVAVPQAIQVSIQALTEDIDLFVRDCIRQSARLRELLSGNDLLIEEICTKVKKQSEGMFLVARLQMEVLQNRPTNLKQLRSLLESLPSGLDAMYKDTLKRISNGSPEDASLARRTLLWLVFTGDYGDLWLSAEALQHALAISYEAQTFDSDETVSTERIIASCAGLVDIRRREYDQVDFLRFIHYTTLEYLRDNIAYFEVPCPHAFISVSCLVYLTSHNSEIQFYGGDESLKSNHEAVSQLCSRDTESPLFWYAYYSWGEHSSKSFKSLGVTHPYTRHLLNTVSSYPVKDLDCFPDLACGLHLAVEYGLLDVISSTQLPFPVTPRFHHTPFHIAAYSGRADSLLSLLSAGYPTSHLDSRDQKGVTPLAFAVKSSSVDTVRTILFCDPIPLAPASPHAPQSVDSSLSTDPTGRVALNTSNIPLTPRPGVDVNSQDDEGQSALMHLGLVESDAAGDVVRLFLSHPDIDVNLRDHLGRPTLYHVLSRCQRRAAATFVHLAWPRLHHGSTALFWACCATIGHLSYSLLRFPVGEHASLLLTQHAWTTSDVCKAASQLMEDPRRTRSFAGIKRCVAPEVAFLLSRCRGSDGDGGLGGPSGDDVALVLFVAAGASCRSLIPLVLAWIRGCPLSYDLPCPCEHCNPIYGGSDDCVCIHCMARLPPRGMADGSEDGESWNDESPGDESQEESPGEESSGDESSGNESSGDGSSGDESSGEESQEESFDDEPSGGDDRA